jgi:hypothetical protein
LSGATGASRSFHLDKGFQGTHVSYSCVCHVMVCALDTLAVVTKSQVLDCFCRFTASSLIQTLPRQIWRMP